MPNGFRILPRADGYFLRVYVVFLGLCAAGAAALVFVADLSQKYKDFDLSEADAASGFLGILYLVVRFYAFHIPQFICVHLLPVLLMFAAVLAITRCAAANEFIALRAVGVSLRRLLAPTLLAALTIGLIFAATRDRFLPNLILGAKQLQGRISIKGKLVPVTLSMPVGDKLQSVMMGHFDTKGRGHNFLIHEQPLADYRAGLNNGVFHEAREVILDPQGPSADRRYVWTASTEKARRVEIGPYHRDESPWTMSQPIPTPMTPPMFDRRTMGNEVLTAIDLHRLAPTDPEARQEIHSRRAQPWACLMITALGAISAMMAVGRGSRPSYVVNMLVALGFAATFTVVQNIFTGLGQNEVISPSLAAWAPVIIGALATGLMLSRIE